jgi:hypothetical protein
MRAADVPRIFPCADECEAQRRFPQTALASAQLSPGVFRQLEPRSARH